MAADLWKQVSDALKQAAELPPPEREDYLAALREQNIRVGSEVERLLRQSATESNDVPGGPTAGWSSQDTPDLRGVEPAKPLHRVPDTVLSVIEVEDWPEQIGRYHIEEEIAGGGAGIVLRARDSRFNRTLAVKLMRRRFLGSAEVVQRFQEEAQITGQLQHPGVPPVYDVGELDDGRPFLTMKLIKGRTLADTLRGQPASTAELPRLLAVFEQLCQTMAYAHSRRIIHRDLKPGNIMVGAFGEVQVMDWGLAKLLDARPARNADAYPEHTIFHTTRDSDSAWETRHGLAMGTPAFMSPEQARGEVGDLDERTDVFSLGAMLCVILTGRPPYPGDRPTEVLAMAQRGELSQAREWLDGCGADLELIDLAKQCLSPERDARPRDAGRVADAVADHLAQVQQRLRQAEIERAQRDVQIREERKRRRVQFGLALSFAALVVVGILAWTWIDRVQAAESARFETQFGRAVSRAETIRDQADAVALTSLDEWKRADQLWRQAVAAADDIRTNLLRETDRPELAARLSILQEQLRKRATAVHTDRQMYERLDRAFEMRADIQDSDYSHAGSAVVVFGHAGVDEYTAAFRDYGVDALKLDPAEAVRRLKGSAIAPRLAEALTDWIVLWYHRPEAKRLLRIVEQLDPDPQRSAVRAALVEQNRKRLVNLARKIDAEKSPPTTILPLADALHILGEIDQAIDLLERARNHRPNEFWYNDVLAVLIAAAHPERVHDAIAYLEAAAALRPRLHVVYGNLAVAKSLAGRAKEAEASCRRAVQLRPESIFNRVAMANLHLAQGRLKAARAEIDACLAQSPGSMQALVGLATIQGTAGRLEDALRTIDRALLRDRDSILTLHTKANILLALNRLEPAAEIGRRLLKNYPHINAGFEIMAQVAYRSGRPAETERLLKDGLRQSVLPGRLRSMLVEFLAPHHRQAALGHARKLVHDLPGSRPRVLQLGGLMERYGLVLQAQMVYWRYLLQNPQDAVLRDRLRRLLVRTGYVPQAEILLADAIAQLPVPEQAKWRAMFLEARKARPVVAPKPKRSKK